MQIKKGFLLVSKYKVNKKNYISGIFWTFKSKLQIIHRATYIHSFFLTLINVFYIFSTIHSYLSLLFSHFVFLFSPSFPYSPQDILQFTIFDSISLQPARNITEITLHSPQRKTKCRINYNQNNYSNLISGSRYELFFPPYQLTFFLPFGQAEIFFSYHILSNILIYILFCDKKIS